MTLSDINVRGVTLAIYSLFVDVSLFFSSRRRHTRFKCDWSSDVCSSDPSRRRHTSELQSHLNLVCRLLLGSEEHTSELQSHLNIVFRLLLEKKKAGTVYRSKSLWTTNLV